MQPHQCDKEECKKPALVERPERREVVAASTYAGPLLALVDMLLAAGATAALFYTIWRCAGAAGDAAATDGRKAHTI